LALPPNDSLILFMFFYSVETILKLPQLGI
jgi:hypothetical protein